MSICVLLLKFEKSTAFFLHVTVSPSHPIQYHPRRPRGYQSGRCDIFGRATFLARKFISRAEEPLGTFPYQTSSRSVKIRSADWPEKYFSGQSTRRSSRVILSHFYTKWFSSSIEREDSREEFQKKKI